MRYFKNIIWGVTIIFLSQLFVSWSTIAKSTAAERNNIFIYEFHEPYHISSIHYKITVSSAKIYFAIDDFTKDVYTDTLKISRKKYNEFVKALTVLHITSRQRTAGPCIGSTTEYFEFYVGTRKQLKGMYSACSPGFSNLAGDLPAAAALFQALIPELEEKLDKIREE